MTATIATVFIRRSDDFPVFFGKTGAPFNAGAAYRATILIY
jgi:hypothetical protein